MSEDKLTYDNARNDGVLVMTDKPVKVEFVIIDDDRQPEDAYVVDDKQWEGNSHVKKQIS